MSVGEDIKRIRESRDMPQVELARRAGVTQAMISQVEKGIRNPSLQVANEIAQVLQCDIEDFLKG